MVELPKKRARFFWQDAQAPIEPKTLPRRYKQVRISLLIAITIIALIPSTLLAVLGYFQYLNLAQKQSKAQVDWQLRYIKGSLQDHMVSLTADIHLIASQLSVSHFENTASLHDFVQKQQEKNKSLVDLKLFAVEAHRLPQSFTTITPLTSSNTIAEGVGIGRMRYDANQTPFFTIAVKKPLAAYHSDIIVHAVIRSSFIEQLVKMFNAGAMDDVFLIDSEGFLQSSSIFFGNNPDRYPYDVPQKRAHIISKNKSWGMGKIFYASSPVAETPWFLVLVKDGPVQKKEWFIFQLSLTLIFVVCATGSFFIIHQLVNILIRKMREADTRKMALLNEAGHTNRLVTIGKLAAGIAHEINNPLAIIDQKAGLIEDILHFSEDFNNKNKFLESIKGIHKSVERCKVITHRLLGFARKMDRVNELLDIHSILQEVLGFLEKEALYNHIYFKTQLDSDLPRIWSDHGQLQQIFLNIISNSIDAIQQDGVIRISTALTQKEQIVVTISDNGPGIPSHVIEHIFDPFFTTKETGKGTGLGLSITYGLIKKLGGDITVSSEPGKGVTFSIYLPATQDHS